MFIIGETLYNSRRYRPSILHQHYLASADDSLRRDVLAAVEKLRKKIMKVDYWINLRAREVKSECKTWRASDTFSNNNR
jgi:hypothetical protein